MFDQDLAADLADARRELGALRRRIDSLERKLNAIPQTSLLSRSFITRVLTVMGYWLIGYLVITAAMGLLAGVIALFVRLLGEMS